MDRTPFRPLLAAILAATCLVAASASAEPPANPRSNPVGTMQGNPVGSFQGDPAQPNAVPPKTPPSPPPKRHPPVIVVTPPLRDGWRPLRTVAGDDQRQAIERALGAPVGEMVSWINAAGAGQVTAVGDRFIDGMSCRDLKQRVTTVASDQETVATYCLGPDGGWLLVVGPS